MSFELSIEFFPPKSNEGIDKLISVAKAFEGLGSKYVSVTYGAGGSTQGRTLESVKQIIVNTNLQVVPHITCIGNDKQQIQNIIKQYLELEKLKPKLANATINKLVVLRGDLLKLHDLSEDFKYATDLLQYIEKEFSNHFACEVAAYPECHPETKNYQDEFKYLKLKQDYGAVGAITQYFYNIEAYFRFIEQAIKYNITIPIIPGIMPISNTERLFRFSENCGAEIPRWLKYKLLSYNNKEDLIKFGEDYVTDLCSNLITAGVKGIHFYTMNNLIPVQTILSNLRNA